MALSGYKANLSPAKVKQANIGARAELGKGGSELKLWLGLSA